MCLKLYQLETNFSKQQLIKTNCVKNKSAKTQFVLSYTSKKGLLFKAMCDYN